jgi:hypothetical protein
MTANLLTYAHATSDRADAVTRDRVKEFSKLRLSSPDAEGGRGNQGWPKGREIQESIESDEPEC